MCGDVGPLRGLSAFSRSRLCPHLCPDPHPHPMISQPPQPLLAPRSGPLSSSTFCFSCPQQKLTFFSSTLSTEGLVPEGETLPIPGAHRPGVVTGAGLILFGNDDRMVTLLLWVPCPYCRLKATHACPGARAPQGGSRLFWRKREKETTGSRREDPRLLGRPASSLSQEGWPWALPAQVPPPKLGALGGCQSWGGPLRGARTWSPGAQGTVIGPLCLSFLLFEQGSHAGHITCSDSP